MGQEKGLMLLNSKPLISYAIDALFPLVDELIVVANDDAYNELGHKVVPDLIPDSGPLGGVYTGLQHSQTDINLVLSCDTPFVSTGLMRYLLTKMDQQEVVVARHQQGIEPLAAVYHKSCLPKLKSLIDQGDLKMRFAIRQLKFLEVEMNEQLDFYSDNLFDNLNTPESLRQAEQRLT